MFDDYCSNCDFRQKSTTQKNQQGYTQKMPTNIYQPTQQIGGTFGSMPTQQMPMGPGFDTTPMGPTTMGPGQQFGQPSQFPGVDFVGAPGSPVVQDIGYTQGFLRANVGKYVKIEFLIGTSMLVDREGVLLDVGISYVVLREAETDDALMCDIYSIKFVRIYQ